MVVSLHSLFGRHRVLIKSKRTLNYFETRDSVCRSGPPRRAARHETSQRLKEQFLQ